MKTGSSCCGSVIEGRSTGAEPSGRVSVLDMGLLLGQGLQGQRRFNGHGADEEHTQPEAPTMRSSRTFGRRLAPTLVLELLRTVKQKSRRTPRIGLKTRISPIRVSAKRCRGGRRAQPDGSVAKAVSATGSAYGLAHSLAATPLGHSRPEPRIWSKSRLAVHGFLRLPLRSLRLGGHGGRGSTSKPMIRRGRLSARSPAPHSFLSSSRNMSGVRSTSRRISRTSGRARSRPCGAASSLLSHQHAGRTCGYLSGEHARTLV